MGELINAALLMLFAATAFTIFILIVGGFTTFLMGVWPA
jgi:hypothetical protein